MFVNPGEVKVRNTSVSYGPVTTVFKRGSNHNHSKNNRNHYKHDQLNSSFDDGTSSPKKPATPNSPDSNKSGTPSPSFQSIDSKSSSYRKIVDESSVVQNSRVHVNS